MQPKCLGHFLSKLRGHKRDEIAFAHRAAHTAEHRNSNRDLSTFTNACQRCITHRSEISLRREQNVVKRAKGIHWHLRPVLKPLNAWIAFASDNVERRMEKRFSFDPVRQYQIGDQRYVGIAPF